MTNKEILTEEDLKTYEKLTKAIYVAETKYKPLEERRRTICKEASAAKKDLEILKEKKKSIIKHNIYTVMKQGEWLTARQISQRIDIPIHPCDLAVLMIHDPVHISHKKVRVTSYSIDCDAEGNIVPNGKVHSRTDWKNIYTRCNR